MVFFISGISTEVGKTVISAIVTEALKADYWKPVQAGDIDYGDKDRVADWISNTTTVIHPNTYALQTPMSPHAAADIDGITINLEQIIAPSTDNHLVIEGAGGLLVPLNEKDTILDLIDSSYQVILVSRHYLGSINHTLLSIRQLQAKGIDPLIIFSGDAHPTTEDIIKKMSGCSVLGRIEEEPHFDKATILKYAQQLRPQLLEIANQ